MAAKTRAAKAPAPRASRHLMVGIGLVNFEVGIAPLMAADRLPRGKTLCEEHHQPVKQAHYCAAGDHCTDSTVIAFEHGDGYVFADRDDAAAEKDGRVELVALVKVDQIDPLYYEKTYTLWPSEGHGTAFDLIAELLRKRGNALTGRTVLSRSTRMIVLRWSETTGCVLMHVCQFDANVRWNDVQLIAAGAATRTAPTAEHLKAAGALLETLAGEFETTGDDDYAVALEEAIDAAAAGHPVETREAEPVAQVVDLMAALTASVDAAKAKPKAGKKVAA